MIRALLAMLLVAAAVAPEVKAQPPACEDTLRTLRVLAEQYAASRQRTEIEAAQTIAGLAKQIEQLRARIHALEAERKAPPTAAHTGAR